MTKKLTPEQKIANLQKQIDSLKNKLPKNLHTHVTILFDVSGSMVQYMDAPQNALYRYFESIKEGSNKPNLTTTVSLFTFGTTVGNVFRNLNINALTRGSFNVSNQNGQTALRDGVKDAIEDAYKLYKKDDPDTSFLFILLTDGEENFSSRCSKEECYRLLTEAQSNKNVTFTFSVPNGRTASILALGALKGNIQEFETSIQGFQVSSQVTASSVSNYFNVRSAGVKSVSNFYQPDLTNVNSKTLKKNFTDITSNVSIYNVNNESIISEFVTAKTKRPYSIGSAYYQLMKTEKVQPGKLVMIQDRTSGKVYGDQDAREMIGLPTTGEIKVKPGNHGNFDVFIQSTSTNRILPRGTKIIICKV